MADQDQEQEQDDEYLHEASHAISAIDAGTATTIPPFKVALYGRVIVEKWFELLANVYTSTPSVTILLFAAVIVVYGIFCIGFVRADTERDINELFIRVEDKENLDYTNRFISGSVSTVELVLQHRPQPDLTDLNTTNFTNTLLDHIEVLRSVIDLPVTFKGRTYTFRDLCTYFPFPNSSMPDFNRIMNTLHTCGLFSPLECYWEGSILQNPPESVVVRRPHYCPEMDEFLTWGNFNYTQFIECMRNNPTLSGYDPQYIQGISALEIEGYVGRNCFFSQERCPNTSQVVEPDSNIFRIAGNCKGAHNGAITPHEIVTGYEGINTTIDQLRAFRTDLFLGAPEIVRSNLRFNGIEISETDTLGLLERWKQHFAQHVEDYNGGRVVPLQNRSSGDLIYASSSITLQTLVDDVSIIVPALLVTGYVLMVLYCGLAFFKFDLMQSRTGAGLVGVFIVFLGTAAALGITAMGGIEFSLLTVQIYPFLVLGLGVDDMFVIVGTFLEIEQKKGRNAPIKELIKATMVAVGPSITLTSVTNFIGFLLVYIIPFPIFRNFVIEVAVAIALNYIGLVIAMPCYLIIDYYRSHKKLMDLFCCIPVWWHKQRRTTTIKDAPDKPEESTKSGFMADALTWMSKANKEYNSILTWFIVNYYSPFLQNYIVKVVAIICFCIVLGFSIWGCTKVEFDIDIKDYGEDGSVFIDYAEIDDAFFRTYAFAVVTTEISYPGLQPQLLEMDRRIRGLSNVLAPTISNRFWLRVMIEYFQGLQFAVCTFNDTTVQGLSIAIINSIEPEHFANEPLCVPSPPPALSYSQECLCNYNLVTVEEFRGEQFTVIPRDKFYYYLTLWATLDGINLSLLQAFLRPTPLPFNPQTFSDVAPSLPLQYSHLNLYVDDLRTAEVAVDHIEDVDAIIEDLGINAYNFGQAIVVFSQFISLREEILIAAAIIVICCFVATTVFLMDLHSGIIMGAILIVNAVEVFGYMGHFNISLNFFAATVYLAGIAIGVEFTAPLVFYFLKATVTNSAHASSDWWILRELGRRNERMHKTLEHRFTPIFNGSVTTFVGVVMLFFAPVRFIRLFFFGVLMIVVIIGLINGLIFLPVLLSIIGPFAQVWPVDDAETIAPESNGVTVVENKEASTSV